VSDRAITSTIYLLNIATLETRPLSATLYHATSPTWSPDGKRIACLVGQNDYDDNPAIVIIDQESGAATTLKQTLKGEQHLAWSPDGGYLAFTARDDTATTPNMDIFVVQSDGTGAVVNLTNHPADDVAPAWSPSGNRIAFQTDRNGNADVYVMQANGANQTQLTDTFAFDGMPSWASDGKYLAFMTTRNGQADIYMMTDSGTDQTPLTAHTATDDHPDWQPPQPRANTDQILFTMGNEPEREIAVIHTTGTGLSVLTTNLDGDHITPSWSPDGAKIAFASRRPQQEFALVTMYADGTNPVYLTDGTSRAMHPVWSPDGSRIGFEMRHDGNWDLYTIEPDGKNLTRLTSSSSREGNITWSPDGTQIAFVSDQDEPNNLDIYVMDIAAGSKAQRRTTHPEPDVYPTWSTDGTHLAFRSSRNENKDIYVMNTTDWIPQRLTFSTADDDQPSWSSDGKSLVFVSNRVPIEDPPQETGKRREFHIIMMGRDGRSMVSMVATQQNTTYPVWKPRPPTTNQD
jgi:Tol biopolymer transport system component